MTFSTQQEPFWELPTSSFGLGWLTGLSVRSPNKETSNEDALLALTVNKDQGLLILADGAGGLPSGKEASGIILEEFSKKFSRIRKTQPLTPLILMTLDRANRQIQKQGKGSGSTAVVLEMHRRKVRSFHVGDSSFRIIGQKGAVKRLTVPHSPVGHMLASGFAEADHPYCLKNRHFVDNLMGFEDMRIEVGAPYRLAKKDTVFMASDGVTDNVTSEELNELIRKGDLDQTRNEIKNLLLERMSNTETHVPQAIDDFSFFLFRLK